MISTVIALPYELARLPFVVLDTSLFALPEDSAPRLTLNRAIGMSDKLAGAVLRNGKIADRGADRIERSDKLQLATTSSRRPQPDESRPATLPSAGTRQAARSATPPRSESSRA